MIVVFVIPDFCKANLRLQPWLTFYRLGMEFKKKGDEVYIITNTENENEIDGLTINYVKSLRRSGGSRIIKIIEELKPDRLYITVTPLSLVTSSWYKALGKYESFAYLSYSFYNYTEYLRAWKYLTTDERISFARLILTPKLLWRRQLRNYFKAVVTQSVTTMSRMKELCGDSIQVEYIPPGTDAELWNCHDKLQFSHNEKRILFTGSPYGIRGFSYLLDAFTRLNRPDIKLKILARGADNERKGLIESNLVKRNLQDNVEVASGWLDTASLKREIQASMAVVLPFVLVPSELPVTVYESIACGTPVIGTNIDGLPGAIGDAGLLVEVGDVLRLADAIATIADNASMRESLVTECINRSKYLPSWEQISCQWRNL